MQGYEGSLCGSCKENEGYVKITWLACGKCGILEPYISGILKLIWITFIVRFISSANLSFTQRKFQKQNSEFIIQVKQMFNHSVVMYSIDQIRFDFSVIIRYVLKFQTTITEHIARILTFECMLNKIPITDTPNFFR